MSLERRRVRLKVMADELGISERKMREFLSIGIPHTQFQGFIWFEPEKVHTWLDKFNRDGRAPGIKRIRGLKLRKDNQE